VLRLGCGSGRDVYLLAQLVGPTGSGGGIDMTPSSGGGEPNRISTPSASATQRLRSWRNLETLGELASWCPASFDLCPLCG